MWDRIQNWIIYGHGGEGIIIVVALLFTVMGIINWVLFLYVLLSASVLFFNTKKQLDKYSNEDNS